MKIIEGMKKIKDLQRKSEDIRKKLKTYHAHMSFETPKYGDDQQKQVSEWIQAHHDLMNEILLLRVSIQRTNLATTVSMELGGKTVTKTIAAWIHRRRDLAANDAACWQLMDDRGLREGKGEDSQGAEVDLKIVRYYDPVERDKMLDMYKSEPLVIDSTLEVKNAVTDLIEE